MIVFKWNDELLVLEVWNQSGWQDGSSNVLWTSRLSFDGDQGDLLVDGG